jgi:hypothetical protein
MPYIIPPLSVVPGTKYILFSPSPTSNFKFEVTLDNADYTIIVNWNLFGQRYYVNIYDLSGALVATLPLIGSPDFYNISITAGYFSTSLIYRSSSNNFEIFDPS